MTTSKKGLEPLNTGNGDRLTSNRMMGLLVSFLAIVLSYLDALKGLAGYLNFDVIFISMKHPQAVSELLLNRPGAIVGMVALILVGVTIARNTYVKGTGVFVGLAAIAVVHAAFKLYA